MSSFSDCDGAGDDGVDISNYYRTSKGLIESGLEEIYRDSYIDKLLIILVLIVYSRVSSS